MAILRLLSNIKLKVMKVLVAGVKTRKTVKASNK
jgi:hypothetical protein